MKIRCLELHHICIPLAKPYKLSKAYGTMPDAHAIILQLHTDEGIVGLGEADPWNPFTEETPASVMVLIRDAIAPHLLGQDPTHLRVLESSLDQRVYGNPMARGAINMALYDVLGKVKGVPVHVLLGGLRQPSLPLLDALSSGTPEEDRATIEEGMGRGYRSFMLKMGVLPIAAEVKRMLAVRETFGDEITILLDANQGWEPEEARAFLDGIRGTRPDLLEQPLKRWNIEGLRRIRKLAPCPVSADESVTTIHDATTLIRERAVDAFSIKVSKNGGLDQARQIALVAEAFGLKCLMNSMLEFGITQAASLQLGCTLPNLLRVGHAYHSVLRMADDVTDFGQNISRGVVTVPTRAGLGVTLDADKLTRYTRAHLEVSGP
jgi:muconate cycloisomerase